MCSLSLAPDCINQPFGNVSDTDVFGGTCGKREKGSFCFVCPSSWALLPALKKKKKSENFSLNFSFSCHVHRSLLPGSEPSPAEDPLSSLLQKQRTTQLLKEPAAFHSYPPQGFGMGVAPVSALCALS